MADTSNLSKFLTDVAQAIRDKKGSDAMIPAKNFDTEIADITTGGGIDTSDATATANDIASGKTAYVNGGKVEGVISDHRHVDGSYGEVSLGNSTVEYAENWIMGGTLSVLTTPNEPAIVDSSNRVKGTVYAPDVAEAIGLTADKIVTGNTVLAIEGTGGGGIDTSDATAVAGDIIKDKTAYVNGEKITGTLVLENGDNVKLFATEEEMRADTTAVAGDLALVYQSGSDPIARYTRFKEVLFPASFSFNEYIESSYNVIFKSDDSTITSEGRLDGMNFELTIHTPEGDVEVEYENSSYEYDNGVFVRRTFRGPGISGNKLTLSQEIYFDDDTGEWSDSLGLFMKIDKLNFGGLFTYKENVKSSEFRKSPLISSISYKYDESSSSAVATWDSANAYDVSPINIVAIQKAGDKILKGLGTDNTASYVVGFINNDDKLCLATADATTETNRNTFIPCDLHFDSDGNFLGIGADNSDTSIEGVQSVTMLIYEVNDDGSYKLLERKLPSLVYARYSYIHGVYDLGAKTCPISVSTKYQNISFSLFCKTDSQTYYKAGYELGTATDANYYEDKYVFSDMPFNATSAQLLPGYTAYSSSGPINGDGTIYDAIPIEVWFNKLNGTNINANNLYSVNALARGRGYFRVYDNQTTPINEIRAVKFTDTVSSDYIYEETMYIDAYKEGYTPAGTFVFNGLIYNFYRDSSNTIHYEGVDTDGVVRVQLTSTGIVATMLYDVEYNEVNGAMYLITNENLCQYLGGSATVLTSDIDDGIGGGIYETAYNFRECAMRLYNGKLYIKNCYISATNVGTTKLHTFDLSTNTLSTDYTYNFDYSTYSATYAHDEHVNRYKSNKSYFATDGTNVYVVTFEFHDTNTYLYVHEYSEEGINRYPSLIPDGTSSSDKYFHRMTASVVYDEGVLKCIIGAPDGGIQLSNFNTNDRSFTGGKWNIYQYNRFGFYYMDGQYMRASEYNLYNYNISDYYTTGLSQSVYLHMLNFTNPIVEREFLQLGEYIVRTDDCRYQTDKSTFMYRLNKVTQKVDMLATLEPSVSDLGYCVAISNNARIFKSLIKCPVVGDSIDETIIPTQTLTTEEYAKAIETAGEILGEEGELPEYVDDGHLDNLSSYISSLTSQNAYIDVSNISITDPVINKNKGQMTTLLTNEALESDSEYIYFEIGSRKENLTYEVIGITYMSGQKHVYISNPNDVTDSGYSERVIFNKENENFPTGYWYKSVDDDGTTRIVDLSNQVAYITFNDVYDNPTKLKIYASSGFMTADKIKEALIILERSFNCTITYSA